MSDSNTCHCNTGIIFGISQCRSCGCQYECTYDASGSLICGPSTCFPADLTTITQKRIWNTVRVPASEYTMNLGSLAVYQNTNLTPNPLVNWNQMSDRNLPANSLVSNISVVPSRGNSTKRSITRDRPGSQRPGGIGVDVKHGSYARYLARLKGKGPLRTQSTSTNITPLKGNKTGSFGIVGSHNRPGSCLCFI